MRRFSDARVAAIFEAYPPRLRARLASLRELVFRAGAATDGVGPLAETVKWGQPSYSGVPWCWAVVARARRQPARKARRFA
jgi:hypothetical protein